ncbi:hypothetical protein ABL78_7782 [Leptomonas seymouri]|uniref:Membrane-associated protein n=1 Tax=Leptomonas seymouri TaxID=5684 RepID=A0A0N1HRX9_LEPSE|nr:hypothetical protein ABL78_7782 [Leptomonas seymouri]|eukprot:KPI83194.1 hypothetical protein ABL78_7782 [Leptomonas seymouri]
MRCFFVLRNLLALLLAVAAVGFTVVRGAAVSTNPTLPLLNVPFCAALSSETSSDSLFVSSASNCSTTLATAGSGCATSGWFAFNITSDSLRLDLTTPVLSVPVTYWCYRDSDSQGVLLGKLQMSVVQAVPMRYLTHELITLTFNDATPVGSVIAFYYADGTCSSPLIDYGNFTLGEDRSIQIRIGVAYVGVCARIASTVSGATSADMLLRNTLFGGLRVNITPDYGVRHSVVKVSANSSFIYFCALSSSIACSDLPPPGMLQIDNTGRLRFEVTRPVGRYYMCVAEGRRLYYTAMNMFNVIAYGVLPNTAYVQLPTSVLPSINATSNMQVALYSSQDCSGTAVKDWMNFADALWSVGAAGTYYACVRQSSFSLPNEYYYANTFVVVPTPTLTANQSVAVRGFGLALKLSTSSNATPSASYIIGLSSDVACTSVYRSATVTNGLTASFEIEEGAANTLYWCVSNPIVIGTADSDKTKVVSYASIGSIPVRSFQLSHGAMRTDFAVDITLDSLVTLPRGMHVAFVPAPRYTCADVARAARFSAVEAVVTSSNTLVGVAFPSAGQWLLCAPLGRGSDLHTMVHRVAVYGDVTVWPRGVVPRIPTSLKISGLQPLQLVFLTDCENCLNAARVLVSGVADERGASSLTLTYNSTSTILVCAAYAGMKDGRITVAVTEKVAHFRSSHLLVFPAVIELSTGKQVLRIVGDGASTLINKILFLASVDTTCSLLMALPNYATVLSPLQQGSDTDTPVTTLTLNDNMMDTQYRVCVETSNTYENVGTITITRASLKAASAFRTFSLVAGQVASLTFPANYTSVALVDSYVVVDGDVDCTNHLGGAAVYARGGIDVSTGAADVFIAPYPMKGTSMNLRVCIAQQSRLLNSTFGYMDGGLLTSSVFTAVSKYALSNLGGGVTGWPVLSYAVLYLVRCSGVTCSANAASSTCGTSSLQYPVSGNTSAASKPNSGTYLLCQRVSTTSMTKVVGSNSTIEVINPYFMSCTADLHQLQAFLPFEATVSGGNGRSVEVVVQPLSVPCGTTAAESQSFTFVPNVQRRLAVTATAGSEAIHFCAKPTSQFADAFEVMTATLVSSLRPTYILFSSLDRTTTVTITVAGSVSPQAVLTRERDCSTPIHGGTLTKAVDGAFTFTISPCGANSDLSMAHFCELSSGIATYRGSLLMLRSSDCTPNDGSASIKAVSVAPGAPITVFGVNAKFLSVSGLSKSSDCSSKIELSVVASGYMPSVDESAAFYVCTYLIGAPTVNFTTQKATLTVRNYAVTPTAVRSSLSIAKSGMERVLMTLDTALPPGYTFFSSGASCANNIGDAPGLNTSAASTVYSHINLCGTVSVCWQSGPDTTPLAVVQFASVTTPDVESSTLAVVRDASYKATFTSGGCNAASTAATTSAGERQVYLSADQCASALDGTETTSHFPSFTASVSSSVVTGLSTASLCVRTSAGMSTVLIGVPVARNRVHPVSFTTGMTHAAIFIPAFASTLFWVITSGLSCSAAGAQAAALSSFSTDASGYGTISIVLANGLPLPVGKYSLCYSSSGSSVSLEAIQVVDPTYFDVRGTVFVTGVSSKMMMQGDLQASHLMVGFSTTGDCNALSTTYGTWKHISATSILVTATHALTAGAYVCARVPMNLSVTALPNAWSNTARSLTFAPSLLAIPSTGFSVCTDYTLQQCTPPNGGGNDETNLLTVVFGDCCNSSDEANAVGLAKMAGGTCTLHFDRAKVRRYPAGTVFSLCAWNSYDASVCATLNYVTVNTDCDMGNTRKGGGGLSGGATAGVAIASLVSGLALLTGGAFLLWFYRYRQAKEEAGLKGDAGSSSSSSSSDEAFFCGGDEAFSIEWSAFLNLPPEGNNCRKADRLGVSTSTAEMRRDVLIKVTGGNGDARCYDSWGEPLDTNFMDDCEELTEKYKDFINGAVTCADSESISDFPGAALLRRIRLGTKALCELAKQRNQTLAAGEDSLSCNDRVLLHELFHSMERTNPAAKALYLFYEEQNYARNAIEISEDTAFFNLRVLFKSYAVMLKAKHGALSAERRAPDDDDGPDGGRSGQCASTISRPMLSGDGAASSPGNMLCTCGSPPQLPAEGEEEERAWLYESRHQLEFPWVTNNFRTLVGYRKDNSERYNYVDWSFTLLDLQAFHPLHRWWSPLLPRVLPPSTDDAQDTRFAFMHCRSKVPFVKRYFMLFKVEAVERVQIEVQAAAGMSAMQYRLLKLAKEFGLSELQLEKLSCADRTTLSTGSTAAASISNPLSRACAAVGDGVRSTDGEQTRSDIGADAVSTGSHFDEEG